MNKREFLQSCIVAIIDALPPDGDYPILVYSIRAKEWRQMPAWQVRQEGKDIRDGKLEGFAWDRVFSHWIRLPVPDGNQKTDFQ